MCWMMFCWCHDWFPDLTYTGVGLLVEGRMPCNGLLLLRSPPLSREWLFKRLWIGKVPWSNPSCWMYPPFPADVCEEWLNQRQRSLRICLTSNSFFPETDILFRVKGVSVAHQEANAWVGSYWGSVALSFFFCLCQLCSVTEQCLQLLSAPPPLEFQLGCSWRSERMHISLLLGVLCFSEYTHRDT